MMNLLVWGVRVYGVIGVCAVVFFGLTYWGRRKMTNEELFPELCEYGLPPEDPERDSVRKVS